MFQRRFAASDHFLWAAKITCNVLFTRHRAALLPGDEAESGSAVVFPAHLSLFEAPNWLTGLLTHHIPARVNRAQTFMLTTLLAAFSAGRLRLWWTTPKLRLSLALPKSPNTSKLGNWCSYIYQINLIRWCWHWLVVMLFYINLAAIYSSVSKLSVSLVSFVSWWQSAFDAWA